MGAITQGDTQDTSLQATTTFSNTDPNDQDRAWLNISGGLENATGHKFPNQIASNAEEVGLTTNVNDYNLVQANYDPITQTSSAARRQFWSSPAVQVIGAAISIIGGPVGKMLWAGAKWSSNQDVSISEWVSAGMGALEVAGYVTPPNTDIKGDVGTGIGTFDYEQTEGLLTLVGGGDVKDTVMSGIVSSAVTGLVDKVNIDWEGKYNIAPDKVDAFVDQTTENVIVNNMGIRDAFMTQVGSGYLTGVFADANIDHTTLGMSEDDWLESVDDMWGTYVETGSVGDAAIHGFGDDALDVFGAIGEDVLGGVGDVLVAGFDAISDQIPEELKEYGQSVIDEFGNQLDEFGNIVKTAGQLAEEGLQALGDTQLVQTLGEAGQDIIDTTSDVLSEGEDIVVDTAKAAEDFVEPAKDLIADTFEPVVDAADEFIDAVDSPFGSLAEAYLKNQAAKPTLTPTEGLFQKEIGKTYRTPIERYNQPFSDAEIQGYLQANRKSNTLSDPLDNALEQFYQQEPSDSGLEVDSLEELLIRPRSYSF